MTADEMFKKLGYENIENDFGYRRYRACFGEEKELNIFISTEAERVHKNEIDISPRSIEHPRQYEKCIDNCFTFREIKAVAKAIEEMEEEK